MWLDHNWNQSCQQGIITWKLPNPRRVRYISMVFLRIIYDVDTSVVRDKNIIYSSDTSDSTIFYCSYMILLLWDLSEVVLSILRNELERLRDWSFKLSAENKSFPRMRSVSWNLGEKLNVKWQKMRKASLLKNCCSTKKCLI